MKSDRYMLAEFSHLGKFGFTVFEVLWAVAIISTLSALAVQVFTKTDDSVRTVKLQQDVASLNRAISTYRLNGGELASVHAPAEALAKLKTVTSATERASMAGLRGSMIDPRLSGSIIADGSAPRAVWNDSTKTFAIATSGSGYQSFFLDQNAVPGTATEEDRSEVMPLDARDHWVWGYAENNAAGRAPRGNPAGTNSPVTIASAAASMTVLQAPNFSASSGLYDYSAFNPDMKVTLLNPNAANISDMYYSVAGGAWVRWTGTPLSVPRALTTEVRTYSASIDPDRYDDSSINTAVYETIFFSGTSSGLFRNPLGDPGMVTNLATGTSSTFTWGSPATTLGFTQPNSLSFSGKALPTIAPEETFELGTLSYYNGTIWTGTGATSVMLKVSLNLTTPGVVENLDFKLDLLSTVNTKETKKSQWWNTETEQQMDDADADYVYIPEVSSQFSTVIKGQRFYLILSFGEHDSNGFTTIDTFHTHENKTMSGTIYGRFSTTPPG